MKISQQEKLISERDLAKNRKMIMNYKKVFSKIERVKIKATEIEKVKLHRDFSMREKVKVNTMKNNKINLHKDI